MMIGALIFILSVCASSVAGGGSPPLPVFPDSFQATVEYTYTNLNFTMSFEQYWDVTNNRVRFNTYIDDVSFAVFFMFEEGIAFFQNLEDGSCFNEPISPETVDAFEKGDHLATLQVMLGFDVVGDYTYVGSDVVRGIVCDLWTADIITEDGISIVNMWFTTPEWSTTGILDPQPLPVAISAVGNAAGQPLNEYLSFSYVRPGTPEAVFFEVSRPSCGVFPPNKPLPAVPNDFVISLEINIRSANLTMMVNEMYDWDLNMARLEYYSDDSLTVTVIDESALKTYTFVDALPESVNDPDSGFSCTMTTGDNPFFASGGHLKPARETFRLTDNTTYWGTAVVRGINADMWKATVNQDITGWGGQRYRESTTYTYYFASAEWNSISNEGNFSTPLRIEAVGTRTNVATNATTPVSFDIDYFGYVPGPAPLHFFQIDKAACGDFPPFVALPTIANDWSAVIEIVDGLSESTFISYEWNDFTGNRIRTDVRDEYGEVVSTYRFFDTLKEYVRTFPVDYDAELNRLPSCTTTPIQWNSYNVGSSNGLPHVKSGAAFFQLEDLTNVVYRGNTTYRGIACQQWFAKRNDSFEVGYGTVVNIEYELDYYFTDPNWLSINEGDGRHLPVAISAVGTFVVLSDGEEVMSDSFSTAYNMIDWTPMRPAASIFAIEPASCGDFPPDRPLPQVTSDFSLSVEMTFPYITSTTAIIVNYDYTEGKVRYVQREDTSEVITIERFDLGKRLTILNGVTCTAEDLSTTDHLGSATELFAYDIIKNVRYWGTVTVRDIECDKWVADLVDVVNGTIEYYFAVSTWSISGSDVMPIPIRITISVPAVLPDGATVFTFDREIIGYEPFTPDAFLFEPPAGVTCSGYTPPDYCNCEGSTTGDGSNLIDDDDKKDDCGGGGGGSIGMLLVGVVIGAIMGGVGVKVALGQQGKQGGGASAPSDGNLRPSSLQLSDDEGDAPLSSSAANTSSTPGTASRIN